MKVEPRLRADEVGMDALAHATVLADDGRSIIIAHDGATTDAAMALDLLGDAADAVKALHHARALAQQQHA